MSSVELSATLLDSEEADLDDESITEFYFEYVLVKRILNPFTVARTLIQLGYEPLRASPTWLPFKMLSSAVTQPFYVYPNLLTYTVHCVSEYGLWRMLSTGFFARLCMDLQLMCMKRLVTNKVVRPLIMKEDLNSSSPRATQSSSLREGRNAPFACLDRLLCRANWTQTLSSVGKLVVLRMGAAFLTQPFYVIFTHQVAAMISGEEAAYSSFPAAALMIFRQEGISGFFSGLAPRMVCEISSHLYCLGINHLLHYLYDQREKSTPTRRKSIAGEFGTILRSLLMTNITSAFISLLFYPYELTGCLMSIQKSKFNIPSVDSHVRPAKYDHWTSCLNYLHASRQQYRGLFPIYRMYHPIEKTVSF